VSAFLDSNVVLYALGSEEPKRLRALDLIAVRPTISTQVVNECSHVLRRKAGWEPGQLAQELPMFLGLMRVVDIGMLQIREAWRIAERYGYSHFDSLIIASALYAGCRTLWTEDLQHGQVIDAKLTLSNPFV
jgi:predicted nucleic acid-binding protein